jgi:hypothetical protein
MPQDPYASIATAAADPYSSIASQDRSAVSPIAPPTMAKPRVNMHPSFLIGDPNKDSTPQPISEVGKGIARNLYQVSAPGIAASILHQDKPGLVSRIPKVGPSLERNATPARRLPGQLIENFALMSAPEGGAEGGASRVAEAERPSAASPTRIASPSAEPSTVLGRVGEVAVRRAGHIPGVQAVKDIAYIARGEKPAPVPAVAKPAPIPETNGIQWGTRGEGPLDLRGKMIPQEPPELTTEARTLPGQIGREVIHPKITPAEPIPPRSGLALPPGPQSEAGSMVRSMESPARMSTPSETARAFRSRSVGERGIPFNQQSPAQASLSETEARSIMPGREQVTGEPQELIGLDLDQAPGFSTKPGPRGADWVKFHGEVPEAAIKPISATKSSAITEEQLGQQLNDALGGRPLERGVPIGKQRPLGNLPEKIREAVGPSQQPPRAPLGNLPKQISEHMNPLPEGFTAVDSSAIRGYKYNPAARELEAVTNSGQHYVHGDVSPEEFSKFEAADSKGKAWNDLRKAPGVTQVATVQNGSRVPTRPGVLQTTKGLIAKSKAGMDPDAAVADQDLTAQLKESVRRAKAERKARAR